MAKQVTLTLTLPDGKRKYFRGATRKEAEAKRDQAKRDLEDGLDIGDNTTVKEFCELWLKEYKEGVVRDVTYMSLSSTLNTHVIPVIGRMKIREVKPAHIQKMVHMMDGKAKSTQARVLSITRSMFTVAVENGLIKRNPCISSVKPRGEETEERVPLTSEQEQLLIETARGTSLYLFVLIGLEAGLRRGELLGLQWKDIDFGAGTISVNRSITPTKKNCDGEINIELKTDAARRTIPISESVIEELRSARSRSKSVYVIPGKKGSFMGLNSCTYHWSNLMHRLPFDLVPHQMRHTRITKWFEQGLDIKDVQYLAGHSNSRMTLDIYTHFRAEERLPRIAEKIRAAAL